MAKPNPVVHFEMGYKDRDRMAKFYETAFGWKTEKYGEEMGNYVVAQTTETDKNGMIKNSREHQRRFLREARSRQRGSFDRNSG